MTIFISSYGFGQSENNKELKAELIGIWEFIELRDSKGNKIDTIWHNIPGLEKKGWEIPEGPLLTYNANGTYSKKFTPKNSDTGKWYYDKKKKAIIQILSYTKPYNNTTSQYLIDKGHAKQDENGDYFENITDVVISISDDKLIILERENRQRTFRKKK